MVKNGRLVRGYRAVYPPQLSEALPSGTMTLARFNRGTYRSVTVSWLAAGCADAAAASPLPRLVPTLDAEACCCWCSFWCCSASLFNMYLLSGAPAAASLTALFLWTLQCGGGSPNVPDIGYCLVPLTSWWAGPAPPQPKRLF
jgi:hypothetical protein